MGNTDKIDLRILALLQVDASLPLEKLAEGAGISRNACWRRVRKLEQDGVIVARVALLNADALGLDQMVFVAVRTDRHEPEWQAAFTAAVRAMPEILGVYRTAGEMDYLLKLRVRNVKDYDAFYQRLIRRVPLNDISAIFVMEEIKETTALPLNFG